MARIDTRATRPGYETSKWAFDKCMQLLDTMVKPEKEKKRQNLMEIYPNTWLDFNMFSINSKNFNIKTLKRFFCHRVLQLSDNGKLPISAYERFFDLEKKPKDYMELTVIVQYVAEPDRLMWRLRELAYETCYKFLHTEDMSLKEEVADASNEKVAAYIEFAHAILLYDVFVQAGLILTKFSFEQMQEEIMECMENGDSPVVMMVDDEILSDSVPLGAVPYMRNVQEMVREETRHLIALYALRTLIQMTEYLCAFPRIKGSKLEKAAIPEMARKHYELLDGIEAAGGKQLLHQLQVSTTGDVTSKYRRFFTYYRNKTLAGELFAEYPERKRFVTECEEYIRWMGEWLEKEEQWKREEDSVIRDENHPEINMASIVFSDEDEDLLPKGKVLWDMFYDAVKEACAKEK